MLENKYQTQLIQKLRKMFPGCFILKNDSAYRQGIPDILILYKDRWAMLEVKRSSRAGVSPNQEYYIDLFSSMSFATFISPEIENEVLDDLQHAFSVSGSSRISER
jgi:hypothetical protein